MIILELVGQGALRGQLPCLASRQSDVEHSSRLGVSSDGHAIHQLRTNRTFEIESREWGGISRGSDSMVSLLAVQIYVYIYVCKHRVEEGRSDDVHSWHVGSNTSLENLATYWAEIIDFHPREGRKEQRNAI